jgi:hypothetical protein
MKHWRQIASGLGLLVCTVYAIVMTGGGHYDFSDRLCCSFLLASFGYLFLSRNTAKEAGAEGPWWW